MQCAKKTRIFHAFMLVSEKQGGVITGGAIIYIKHLGNAWIIFGGLDGGQMTK
jgi:hypothetical protein